MEDGGGVEVEGGGPPRMIIPSAFPLSFLSFSPSAVRMQESGEPHYDSRSPHGWGAMQKTSCRCDPVGIRQDNT